MCAVEKSTKRNHRSYLIPQSPTSIKSQQPSSLPSLINNSTLNQHNIR